MMASVRLPDEIEKKLENIAQQKNVPKSVIIKEALVAYMAQENKYNKPYELGAQVFGKYGSGEANKSTSYKSKIKEKIRAKRPD